MEITLSDGTVIDVLLVNFEKNYFDWKRREGEYTGVCMTQTELTDFSTALSEITDALEAELVVEAN